MQKRKTTSVTSWRVTAGIKHPVNKLLALCACIAFLSPAALQAQTQTLTVPQILSGYQHALSPSGAKPPTSFETSGTLVGAHLSGIFHQWHQGDRDRFDQSLGAKTQHSLQLGERRFEQNGSENVIELKGLYLRRAITQDFINSSDLFAHPEYVRYKERSKLEDGRDVYRLEITPPNGETETIDVDTQTFLLDRLEFLDGDGTNTDDFSDYRPVHGYLFSYKQVQSDGDHPFDITQTTTKIVPNKKIAAEVFAPFVPARLIAKGPVTVPLIEERGALYTQVVIHGRTFNFLIDSGAQGVVLDSRVATRLGLLPEGSFEARGASRMGGIGVTSLDQIHIGDAILPVHSASILDLAGATEGRFPIDGILGYPLFGSAMVQIDYAKKTMTLAPPGGFAGQGTKFDIDVDRELPEIQASVDGIEGRFLIDTGNGNELLLFHDFVEAHRGMLGPTLHLAPPSFGVGGSTRSYMSNVDVLDIGPFRMFHRNTNVVLSTEGAFADHFDAGNIGLGVLQNFIVTFDAFNRTMYLERGSNFNDGHDRIPPQPDAPTWHTP
ncbi:MAG: aspartyl protease family protein [Candidatus Eremiobacteraeota bacterium]|nr:aspartyl protease family protein [Candidatus Eremiobacteraeota bacterium]